MRAPDSDQILDEHPAGDSRAAELDHYTELLLDELPEGAEVLELGVGHETSRTRRLAERFCLVGIDVSAREVERAGEAAPGGWFLQADIGRLSFALSCFDGVAAFHSLHRLPLEERHRLVRRIVSWLRPGGLFVGGLGPDRRLLEAAGLRVVSASPAPRDGDAAHWFVARKAAAGH